MKQTSFLCAVCGALVSLFTLQSCLNDDTYGGEDLLFAVGTVRVIEGQDYYFELDEGSLLYPTDTTSIHGYDVVDGQRAFVYFNPLAEELSGYDYNAKLEHIENILTKNIYSMPADKADSIGHDRIDADDIWLTEDHINIVYKIYHSNNPEEKHMLNLVIDEAAAPATDNSLHLHFRHNAYNDAPIRSGTGIVSFRLDKVRDLLEGKQGFRIHVPTIYNGEQTYTVNKTSH